MTGTGSQATGAVFRATGTGFWRPGQVFGRPGYVSGRPGQILGDGYRFSGEWKKDVRWNGTVFDINGEIVGKILEGAER